MSCNAGIGSSKIKILNAVDFGYSTNTIDTSISRFMGMDYWIQQDPLLPATGFWHYIWGFKKGYAYIEMSDFLFGSEFSGYLCLHTTYFPNAGLYPDIISGSAQQVMFFPFTCMYTLIDLQFIHVVKIPDEIFAFPYLSITIVEAGIGASEYHDTFLIPRVILQNL